MLVGKINDRNRQKLLVTIRNVKGIKMIDFRLHHTADDGELVGTPAGVSLTLIKQNRQSGCFRRQRGESASNNETGNAIMDTRLLVFLRAGMKREGAIFGKERDFSDAFALSRPACCDALPEKEFAGG